MNDFYKNSEYKRELYLEAVAPYIDKHVIKVIIGMRRSGKSVLLRQLICYLMEERKVEENKILYIDKELDTFDFLRDRHDLSQYVNEKKPNYLFIDEVQEIKDWEKAVASFHKEHIDVYITGSNAKMLSSDLATYLAGRYISIPIYTLSFKEFVQFHKKTSAFSHEELFQKYIRLGGFPVLLQFKGDERTSYALVRDIWGTIILKDVIARHQIRRIQLFNDIVKYAADNVGNLFSANKVATYLKSQKIKLDVETVNDYMGHLVSTFALHKVPRYDVKGKRHLEISEKYYLGDICLRHSLLGYRPNDINQFLENIVFLELRRRGYDVSIGKLEEQEIDFIAQKREEKIYIQVCYLLATKEVFEREFDVLRKIKDNYRKLVLSMDGEMYASSFEGIERKNLVQWLLEN